MCMRKNLRTLIVSAGVVFGLLAASAKADHHEILISEVYPGTVACPGCAFVELQMHSSGQKFLDGHYIVVYNDGGASVTPPLTMDSDVANGQNNRHILLGDSSVSGRDFTADIGGDVDPDGGAVCFHSTVFGAIDCVAWGSYMALAPPSPVGTPQLAIPDGWSIFRRLDRSGCATFLEASDDSNNSSADFGFLTAPDPRNNAAPVTGACPNTRFTKKPRKKTTKRKAVFRFKARPAAESFACKLDSARFFRSCGSPYKKRVKLGKHVFKVKAAGELKPATYRWKVVRR